MSESCAVTTKHTIEMPEKSQVTVREAPVEHGVAEGSLLVRADSLLVETTKRIELVDVTAIVIEHVQSSGIRAGLTSLFSLHTTCALFINETQQALHADILRVLEQIIDRDADWLHNDPRHSDCDRMNADSHLRAMLLGHSVMLQVAGGRPVLGQFQRVLVAEMDGPRERTIRVQTMGAP